MPKPEERGFDSLFVAKHTYIPLSRKSSWPGGRELLQKYYRKLRVTARAPTRTAAKDKIEPVAEEILYRLAGYRLREQETGYDRQIPAERVRGTAAAPPPVAPDALGRIGAEVRIKRERVPTREDEET